MSDDDIRAVFRRIDDGPPLGIDAREVMADGRRVRTLRTRLTIVGSALTAAAAAAAAIALSLGGGQSPDPDLTRPAGPPTTATTPSTAPVPQTTPLNPPGAENPAPEVGPPPNGKVVPVPGNSPGQGSDSAGTSPPVATTS